MTDSEIIAAVRAGDRDVFATLVERHQRTLYYFVAAGVPFAAKPIQANPHHP